MMRRVVIAFLVASTLSVCKGEFGPCRYDQNACSCKLGNENQGVCWDRIPNDPLNCRPRSCKKGWTCACGGRTHVCKIDQMTSMHNTGAKVEIGEVQASIPTNNIALANSFRQISTISRPCSSKSVPTASTRELILGTAKFGISSKGTLANKCTFLAWWHNGVLMGNYKPSTDPITTLNVDSEMKIRDDHSLLELRPGDLIAFRFKDTSYYCYKHIVEFTINGVKTNSTQAGFDTRFARKHTDHWYSPQFTPVLADSELSANLTSFTPLRSKFLPKTENSTEFGAAIEPGVDYWQPPTTGANFDQNHKISNFYFRVQIPQTLPTSFRAANGDDKIFMRL